MENFTTFGIRIPKLFLFLISFLISSNYLNAQADLQLSLAVDNPNYTVQEIKSFTLNLQNTGPDNASNIKVSFLIPNILRFSGASATLGNYDPVSSEWIVSSLQAGQTATLSVELFATNDLNELTLFAQVLSVDQTDPDSSPGNNNGPTPNEDDEAAITITPIQTDNTADMELEMTSNRGNIEVGQHIIIDIVAFNKGPRDANNIVIAVLIPDGFSILSSSPTIGAYSNGSWTIPNFDNGNTGRLTIVARADANNGTATFFAQFQSVDTNDSDSTPGNNSGTTPQEDDEAAVTIVVTGTANCVLTDAGVNVFCHDNGTVQRDDDSFSITLNPTGQNLGTTYHVTGGIIANDLPYGTDSEIGTFPISDGAITINIEDASGTCQLNDVVIDPPEPCSPGIPDCTLSDAGLVISCDDNGTPEMADDKFIVTINPQGTNLSNTYNITGDITGNGFSYGTASNLGTFLISDGNLSINIVDASGNCQINNIAITAPEPCSQITPGTASISGTIWLDSDRDATCDGDCSTQAVAGIQVILFEAGDFTSPVMDQFSDDSGGYQFSNIPTDKTYVIKVVHTNELVASPIFGVDNGVDKEGFSNAFTLTDGEHKTLNIALVDGTVCTLSQVFTRTECNDNGTSDPSDDFFTISYRAEGAGKYLVTGVGLEKENLYGDWIETGLTYPINSEPVRLVFTNLGTFPNLDCSFILFVNPPEPCSDNTPITDGIDLELSLSADNTDFNIYEYVTYTLVLENKGTEKATGIRIDFQQPLETAFVSQNLDKGTYYNWTGIWKDIDLEAGEKASLKLRIFTLFGDKPLVAFAQVIAADQDDIDSTPDNANNMTANEDDEALLTLGAVGPTDLELKLSTASSSFKIYENTIFTCTVSNTSQTKASNISVKFPLPKGMVFTNAHTDNGNYNLYYETWIIGSLAPGETASLDLILFHLENESLSAYAEVKTASPNDLDSTPDNYQTNPDEDDSDTVMLTAIQKRSLELPETEIDQTQKLKIFEVFPNPVADEFQVILTSKITTEIHLQIYDIQGRLVKEKEMMMIPGPNRIRLNLAQQTSGIYQVLILYQNGKFLRTSIVKQE